MPDQMNAYAKGVMGETAAFEYLLQSGMQEITRRYRSPYGEIDLIMLDDQTLVFVEVKTREHGTFQSAQLAVTPKKQHRLIQTARCFLGDHPHYAFSLMRFDIVTVTREGISHIANAFEGREW